MNERRNVYVVGYYATVRKGLEWTYSCCLPLSMNGAQGSLYLNSFSQILLHGFLGPHPKEASGHPAICSDVSPPAAAPASARALSPSAASIRKATTWEQTPPVIPSSLPLSRVCQIRHEGGEWKVGRVQFIITSSPTHFLKKLGRKVFTNQKILLACL